MTRPKPREKAAQAPRDVRPPVRPRTVEAMLTAASDAAAARYVDLTEDARGVRFPEPPSWPQLRAFFHAMALLEQPGTTLRLLGEEARRIETDRGADLARGG